MMRMIAAWCGLWFFTSVLFAQPTGKINGKVISLDNEKPVVNVSLKLAGTPLEQLSTINGEFSFVKLKPEIYYLLATKEGFYITAVPGIQVEADKVTEILVEMVAGNPDAFIHMSLGGVTITEERLLVPEDHQTTHKISSGEIEHLQATSLRDVMDLIPGIVRGESDVPGLARASRVQLRDAGYSEQWGQFGTQVMVDGIPQTNNANRQGGVGVGYGATVTASANTGVDLRTIVADNIESVEVMPGVASPEYGDFTDGIINVKTKSGEYSHRLKIKNNPETREYSLLGGRKIGGALVNYTLNYAFSERNLRVKGDEVKRLVGELKFHQNLMPADALVMIHKFHFDQMFDNDEDPNDPNRTTAFNRDYNLSYGGQYYWHVNPGFDVEATDYFRFTRRNSYKKQLEKVDLRLITGSELPGTFLPADTLVGAYLSEVKTLGEEYNVGLKLQGKLHKRSPSGWSHELQAGVEFAYDANSGQGKVFDPLRPPGGTFSIRQYSFDQEPGSSGLSFYAEDLINGYLLLPVKLTLGFRYDLYNPYRLFGDGAVVASQQGNFLNPRLGLLVKLLPKTQLRLSYGIAAKRPSIDIVYNQPYFLDLMDVGIVNGDSVQLVTTYRYERQNPKIKGYQQAKYSLGFDQEVGPVGISITGYYQESSREPRQVAVPLILHHYYYPDFMSAPQNRAVVDTLYINNSSINPYHNIGWVNKYGVEFSLTTRQLQKFNTKFRISAAYNHQTAGYSGYAVSNPMLIEYQFPNSDHREKLMAYPFYEPLQSWYDQMVVNYFIDYMAKSLEIWVTLSAQNVPLDRSQYYPPGTNLHAVGFTSIYGTTYLSPAEAEAYKLMRQPASYDVRIIKVPGDKWLFSLNVSKALFPGSELSLYVINIFNDYSFYLDTNGLYLARNPEIFYGIEFSLQLDNLWRSIHE